MPLNIARVQVGMLCVLIVACTHPHGHTPDSLLRTNFEAHERSFIALLDMVLQDTEFLTITTNQVVTRTRTVTSAQSELVGMSKERYSRYLDLFRAVGVDWVSHGEGGVAFRKDGPSFANGDSTKGYLYSSVERSPCVQDLDSYVPTSRSRPWSAYSALKPHWYLYLDVD